MKYHTRNLLILLLGLVLGVSLSVGHSVFADRKTFKTTLPLEELAIFTEVFAKIKDDYVEEVDDKELLENAIRGMLSGLDPHSAFLDQDEFKEMRLGTSGEFGGLGIEVTMENGFVRVLSPIDDTPAQKAGLKAGDIIFRLNDIAVKGLTLKEAVDIMRGKPGTDITLMVIREGAEKPIEFKITRAKITVKSVKSRSLGNGFAYLRITQFQQHTGEDLLKAIDKLNQKQNGPIKGLVLDLRNNPGGVLNGAVSVADAFLEKGLIVYTKGRIDGSKLEFNAHPEDVLKKAPLVVLVNGGSASASEIVAGALQDHKRAVIMGEKTFGKGSVQTILPMKKDTALKLTTARYYTPSGRTIQAEGIHPDIVLEDVKVATVDNPNKELISEASLSGHLENDKSDKTQNNTTEEENTEIKASSDFQLYEALNLLKGLYILQNQMN